MVCRLWARMVRRLTTPKRGKEKKTSVGGPTDPLERTSQCKSQDDPHCSVLVLFTPHSSHAFPWRCCASLGMPFFLPGIYPVGFIGFRDTNTQTQKKKKKSLGAKGWFASSVFFCGRKARTGKQGNTETTETSTQKMSIKFFFGSFAKIPLACSHGRLCEYSGYSSSGSWPACTSAF